MAGWLQLHRHAMGGRRRQCKRRFMLLLSLLCAPCVAAITVGRLSLTLRDSDQTIAALQLSGDAGADGFSFTAATGAGPRLGDASIRVRKLHEDAWTGLQTGGAVPLGPGKCAALPCRPISRF